MRAVLAIILFLLAPCAALAQSVTQPPSGMLKVSTDDGSVSFTGVTEIQFPANQVRIVGRKAVVFTKYGLASSDIPNLDASKVTSGIFAAARLGTGTADNTKCLKGDLTWGSCLAGVTSFNGRTGAVTPQSGDYNTDQVSEGTTNLYWTNSRFDTRFGLKSTTNLAEGSNLYWTQARFDTAFSAKSTTNLSEGTNLYYTDARARAALSASAPLSYNNSTGAFTFSYNATNLKLTGGALNTIQDIATSSTVQFGRIGIGAAANASYTLDVQGIINSTVAAGNSGYQIIDSGVGCVSVTFKNGASSNGEINLLNGATCAAANVHLTHSGASYFKGGDLGVTGSGAGLILKSPGGTCYRISVDNSGVLSTASVACV